MTKQFSFLKRRTKLTRTNGGDEIGTGISEHLLDKELRSVTSTVVDQATGDEETTDTIIFYADVALIITDFANAFRLSRAGKTVTKSLDDVLENVPTGPLSHILEGHGAGQGFSGAFDDTTGKVLFKPSTPANELPSGWVRRRGGHRVVSGELGGSSANHRGFAAILQEDGTLHVTWRSGQLNRTPGSLVPSEMRKSIVEAIEAATGRTVSSY